MHVPVVEQGNGHSRADGFENFVGHHVRATTGSVDREEAERGEVQSLDMVVRMAKQLRGALAGRVGGEGTIGGVGLDERDNFGVSVRGGCRGEDEVWIV